MGYHHSRKSKASSSSSSSTASLTRLLRLLTPTPPNTLTELRRIEKDVITLSRTSPTAASDIAQLQTPMTNAWTAYVNSHNLLSELRGLTRNYPFDNQVLDEAKWKVIGDPDSNRSWNFAWLVLIKIGNQGLIQHYAAEMAGNPEMWGGRAPEKEEEDRLREILVWEWGEAVRQLLRHWETPPTTTGY